MNYRNVLLVGLYCCFGLACTNASNELSDPQSILFQGDQKLATVEPVQAMR